MKVDMPEAKFVTLDNLKIEYYDWGNADKPAVVWLHGGTGHPIIFAGNIEYFKDRYHCLGLTHRGHGDSDRANPSCYTEKDLAYELALFIEAMGIKKVSLIGSSSAGRICILYAANHPERVDKLIFTETNVEIPAEVLYFFKNAPPEPEFNSWDEFFRFTKMTRNPNATDEQVRALASATGKQLPNGKIGWKYDPAYAQAVNRICLEEFRAVVLGKRPDPDYWYLLTQVKCPTLIIRGTKDPMAPREEFLKMAAIMDKARLLELEAGHVPFWDKADEFNAAVEKFLVTGV